VLRFTSCQAEIAESFCKALTIFIGKRLGVSTEFVGDIPWQERERLLDSGHIDVCWICGLPYVRKSNVKEGTIQLLAAPIMAHQRYAGRPVYYSDVVVHADTGFQSFEDLRGVVWAYNEPASHSGHNLVRYHLATSGVRNGYFSRVVESGSHQESLRMLLDRTIDAAAIDSTVLEMAFVRSPLIVEKIRTVTVLGPSPAPPWVIHRSVPHETREALRQEFLQMHENPEGQHILKGAGILRFANVSDRDYDAVREMDRIAAGVDW
jgi:phosphate/phosphite/phosphonate ABC transporter binding protein